MVRISILGLWALCAVISVAGPVLEGRERSAERSIQAYATAMGDGRLDEAIALLIPETRSLWRIFVEHQVGDRIQILSTAVQRRALLADLKGWSVAQSVTVNGDITGKGGEHWRGQSLVRGQTLGGQWLMRTPLFGPDEPWLIPPES